MADQKLTELSALSALTTDDLFYVVDDPSGTAASKKLAVSVLDDRYLLESNNLSDLPNAGTARTNLGIAIGSDVQAYDAQLDDLAGLTPTKGNVIVGDGSNFVALGVGANDELLTTDSGEASGVKWAAVAEVSILQIQVFS